MTEEKDEKKKIEENDIGEAIACLCCFIMFAFILLIFIMGMFFPYTYEREDYDVIKIEYEYVTITEVKANDENNSLIYYFETDSEYEEGRNIRSWNRTINRSESVEIGDKITLKFEKMSSYLYSYSIRIRSKIVLLEYKIGWISASEWDN